MKNQLTLWLRRQSLGLQALAGNRTKARDWQRQPMGRSQESVARSAAWDAPGAAICLPPLCWCESKIEVWHDNNMHHALSTHTHIFPFQIELHRDDWIFLLCTKDKNTPLSFSTPLAPGSIITPCFFHSSSPHLPLFPL